MNKNTSKILFLDIGLFVDKKGNVYLSDKTIKHQYVVNGYLCVKHKQKRYQTHRLIAESFIPNIENKTDVNHKDGNKLNNSVENLEWVSRTENIYHSLRTGLHANPEKSVTGVCLKTGKREIFFSVTEASRKTKALQPNISKCLANLRKSAGGFKWSYNNETA